MWIIKTIHHLKMQSHVCFCVQMTEAGPYLFTQVKISSHSFQDSTSCNQLPCFKVKHTLSKFLNHQISAVESKKLTLKYLSEISLYVLLERVHIFSMVICCSCKNYLSIPYLYTIYLLYFNLRD